jgi:YVTN family beta-propeller protein
LKALSLFLLSISVLSGAAQAQTKAYIASTAANAVTVIDTASKAVLGAIAVGVAPTRVAITPDGVRAYVSNRDSGTVSAIDTMTDTVVATIPVGDGPGELAVTPDGGQVYVILAGGVVQVIDRVLDAVVATIRVPGSGGAIAMAPDGARAYVASGPVSVIDTATQAVVESFALEAGNATGVAISPDGTRAYFTATASDIFSGGSVVMLDTATAKANATLALGALPGQIALAPDGGRAYVAIQSVWMFSGYAAGFLPGRTVEVIDTATLSRLQSVDLGAYNTAAAIAVTPDRSAIYASIPRLSSVGVIDTGTNALTKIMPVAAGASGLAIISDPSVPLEPRVVDAVDDKPAFSIPSTGAIAVANVLANDRLAGAPATLANVALSQLSSSDPRIGLDAASGSVHVAAGAAAGSHSLIYRICELENPRNCDEAAVLVSVRNPNVIDAVNDSATALAGRAALASVLANDKLGSTAATLASVKLAHVSSTHAGITLNAATGSVSVSAGTPAGSYSLAYRICEIADPLNCDQASVAVSVMPSAIDAVDDAGVLTLGGGLAVANVLANDRLGGALASVATVTLASVSSTDAGIGLNATTGAVVVASGTAAGAHSLVYRICERSSPSNCDQATVTVTVKPAAVNAVNDFARASARRAGTALASVLANDAVGVSRATTDNVTLRLVSLTPDSDSIRLDLADGSVDVLGRLRSGVYVLTYQICEIASLANCDSATVTLDLRN